jgi:hypothetical protein
MMYESSRWCPMGARLHQDIRNCHVWKERMNVKCGVVLAQECVDDVCKLALVFGRSETANGIHMMCLNQV